MVLRYFFSIFLLFIIFSERINAQEKKDIFINETFQNEELKSVLKTLSEKYDIKFAYDDADIKNIKINQKFKNEALSKTLKTLFSKTNLKYQISENTILLYSKTKTNFDIKEKKTEKFTLQGIVKDAKTGESLPYASIIILNTQTGTYSNVDGYFSLLNFAEDTLNITVMYLGYLSKTIRNIHCSQNKFIYITLDNEEQSLKEINVIKETNKILEIKNKRDEHVTINPKFFKTMPNLGEADAFRAIQLLSGISGSTESAAEIKVQGGNSDQNLVLYDGFTVYHLDHFYGTFSAFNSNAIKNIDIYKSGFGAKYGGRVSSVIDITGKSGNFNKFSASANLNLISLSGNIEIPIVKNKVSLFIAARRSYTDLLQSYLYKDLLNGLQSNSSGNFSGIDPFFYNNENNKSTFYFYDLNSKLTFRINTKNIVSFSFYQGLDKFNNSFSNADYFFDNNTGFMENNSVDTKWGNKGFAGKWSKKWNENFYSKINLAYSKYFSDFENKWQNAYFDSLEFKNYFYTETQKNSIQEINFQLNTEYLPNNKIKIEFGTEISSPKIIFENFSTNAISNNETQSATILSAYSQGEFNITKNIIFTSGIRNSFNNLTHKNYFEPRFSSNFQIAKNINISVSIGKYYQFINQTVYNNILSGNHDFWILSDNINNPELSSFHYNLSLSYSHPDFNIIATIFRKKISGLSQYNITYTNLYVQSVADSLQTIGDSISNQSDFIIDNSVYQSYQYNLGNGFITGTDFMIYKKSGIWNSWISISYFDKKIKYLTESEFYSSNIVSENNFEFKTVNQINIGKWNFSGTWVFNSVRQIPKNIENYRINVSNGYETTSYNQSQKEAQKFFNYHRMDISVSRIFKTKFCDINTGISVLNLYNRKNIKLTQYYFSYWNSAEAEISSTPSVTGNAVKLLSFTPVFYLNFNF